MKRRFVAPALVEQATLSQLTQGFQCSGQLCDSVLLP